MTQRQVTLEGGVPWGFRIHGGADLKTPLKVSRVNPGSKAAQRGIREGDLITSINGESTKNLTNNEAHNLLKRSGSTLKLGLNEDIEGSPKKRHYRTIHHETHQETVKRSSVTYTLKETIERSSSRSQRDNEFEAFKASELINGRDTKQNGSDIRVVTNIPVSQVSTSSSSSTSTPSTLVPEGKNISSDHAIASRQSSYSNCSSIPDEGLQPSGNQQNQDPGNQEMNDGQDRMSKSKKRRQRRKNLFNRSLSQSEVEIDEIEQTEPDVVLEPVNKSLEILRLKRIEHKYKVESPKELKIEHVKSNQKKLKIKSKSLDDDEDLVRIQELSEASESEDSKCQSHIVITEASSEENLLEESDLLQSNVSPEEELALRNFLGGLKLVNSPEESVRDLYERTTGLNDSKAKKQQKRKELEEYFKPIADNPRYLDAISEEASDLSDKEGGVLKRAVCHLKQGTPEHDDLRETKILPSIEVVPITEERAEVVFLEDSGESSLSTSDMTEETGMDDEVAMSNSSQESLTTVSSSFTRTSKKVSKDFDEDLVFTKLTPPPTPKSSSNVVETRMHFDYTRMPNILKEKEPDKGHVNGDGDTRKLDDDIEESKFINREKTEDNEVINKIMVKNNDKTWKSDKTTQNNVHTDTIELRNTESAHMKAGEDFKKQINKESIELINEKASKDGDEDIEKAFKEKMSQQIATKRAENGGAEIREDLKGQINKENNININKIKLISEKLTENVEKITYCNKKAKQKVSENSSKEIEKDFKEPINKHNELSKETTSETKTRKNALINFENDDIKKTKDLKEQISKENNIEGEKIELINEKLTENIEKTMQCNRKVRQNLSENGNKEIEKVSKEQISKQNKLIKETTSEAKTQEEAPINVEKTFQNDIKLENGDINIRKDLKEQIYKESNINIKKIELISENIEKTMKCSEQVEQKVSERGKKEIEKDSNEQISKQHTLSKEATTNEAKTQEEALINVEKTSQNDINFENGDIKIGKSSREQINKESNINIKKIELINENIGKTMQCREQLEQKVFKKDTKEIEKDSNEQISKQNRLSKETTTNEAKTQKEALINVEKTCQNDKKVEIGNIKRAEDLEEQSEKENNTNIKKIELINSKFAENVEDTVQSNREVRENLSENGNKEIKTVSKEQISKQNKLSEETTKNETKIEKEALINVEKTFQSNLNFRQGLKEEINKESNINIKKIELINKNIEKTMQCVEQKVSEKSKKETEKDSNEQISKQHTLSKETTTNEAKTQKEALINVEKPCQNDKKLNNNKTIQTINETRKESVLKHVMMTSKDSNKTDSQKLLEFESIKKLNSELRDKISRFQNVPETVVMHCNEELPGKDFVQRRVKEFCTPSVLEEAKETENNEIEKRFDNLIQSRVKTFSNETKKEVGDGSVLKRIILPDDKEKKEEIHLKTEQDTKESKSEVNDNNNEKLIPIKLELHKKESNKEIIIPIKIEDSTNTRRDDINLRIIPIQLENESKESSDNIVEQRTNKKEKNIPIKIEKHAENSHKDEHIIPIKIENKYQDDIRDINKSLINIVENNNEQINREEKAEPPIPPPRRSKAFLLRKRNEALKPPQSIESSEAKKGIPVSSDMTYTNILSPPRPASASSDSSTSEGSSRCTAKYNPNSSIGDVASITKDDNDSKPLYEPMSLRDIVLKRLMSLPFGDEILRELAEVSKAIESFTSNLPFRGGLETIYNNNDISPYRNQNMPSQWYAQSDIAKKTYGDERQKIVELHQKFLAKRKHEANLSEDNPVNITRETEVTSPNRLLTIIREEPNESDFLYYEDNSDERLKAKNLGEWLTLARHKSKSTSNLDRTNIPINNLRRTITSTHNEPHNTRRHSLPQEIYEEQLINIMEKEREIQRELEKLEEEKRKLRAEIAPRKRREFQVDDFYVSKRGDFAERRERPASMPVFPTEFFRQQMYEEYMDKFSEREERKQQKVIKISSSNDLEQDREPHLKTKEIIHPIEIEQEFMDRVKEKQKKNHREDSSEEPEVFSKQDTPADEPPVIVLDGDKVRGIEALPPHLQEFVGDLATRQEASIWSPGQPRRPPSPQSTKQFQRTDSQNSQGQKDDPVSPVWTPKSATSSPTVERKEFRPVNFQSPVLSRKNRTRSETIPTPDSTTSEPPWRRPEGSSDSALDVSSTLDRGLPTSQSSPGFGIFSTSPRLPKAQNPTITLLQKAREGQLPRGAHYIDQDRRPPNDRPPVKYPGEVLYFKNEYTSESDSEKPKKMADLTPRKFEGIGPTTKDGMPLILRSEVKDKDQSKWYKRMYDTIHKQKPHKDEFITVRYKQKRAHYPYSSGYLSEPEPGAYDSDFTEYKYQTLDRRRTPQTHHYIHSNSATMPRNVPDSRSYSSSDIIRNNHEKYSNQPGRIENYRPGHSSISEKEAKQWWDEVMDIFDGHLEQQSRVPVQKPRSFINQALKESGYESDSTLVFKRKQETAASQLSPKEQREAYKIIQKGGDVPFQGLRKPAPERPKEPDLPPPPPPPKSQGGVRSQEQESPRKYVENEVTIHYKTPVRTEVKEYVSEDELAHRQAEAMKKIYEEERKRKYLQELQDMKSRRHTDNFIPSQKSPIPLNRYDDFDDLATPTKTRPRSPEPRLVARALYNFLGQTVRELTFRKGDLIYVRRQVDKNWYEGELNAMVGLFPVNYVEIVPYEGIKTTPRKAHEGQARAKYNFVAHTHLELSLAKGELVTITRRVDDNWFEGKIGGRKGIFPVSYVDILIDPSEPPPSSNKPVAAPAAHSLLLNGSAQGKESMGSHLYTPNIPNPIPSRDNGYHHAKPIQLTGAGTYSTLPKNNKSPIDQALHIETQSEPIPYRALYKYTPQNDDELELLEGDTVYVLEKCDDGWYVGSSDRTGAFGTFPGNYVEKI